MKKIKQNDNNLIKEISMLIYGIDLSYDPQAIKERINDLLISEKVLRQLQERIEVVRSLFR